jgi:glycosyltransferase involved in cell wall biosynthesis
LEGIQIVALLPSNLGEVMQGLREAHVFLRGSEALSADSNYETEQDVVRKKPLVVACIPAYNEMATIGWMIVETRKFVDAIIVCDDGSFDFTYDIACGLGVNVIKNEKNMGKGYSLKRLFSRALELEPDVVVMLDSDGQHDPNYIPKLIEPILKGEADVVIGSRYMDGSIKNAPYYRRIGLRLINNLRTSVVRDTQSGMRAFSGKALKVVNKTESDGYGVETEQISLAKKFGLRLLEVPIVVRYGNGLTTSKKNPFSHGLEILLTILRLVTEDRPLLFLGVPACLTLCVSIVSGYYLLFYYETKGVFSISWTLLFFFSFIIAILLGVSAIFLYSMQRLTKKFEERIESLNERK